MKKVLDVDESIKMNGKIVLLPFLIYTLVNTTLGSGYE